MLLGELIGTATGNKSGLMSVEDKKRLGRRFFKGYTKLVESKYWYNHYVALIFGASPASNLGSLIAIDWKGDEPISVTRFLGNNDNVKLYLGRNPETNMHELWLGLIGLDLSLIHILTKGTNEYLAGIEFDVTKQLTLSCGGQITDYGLSDNYQSDTSFSCDSYSLGVGAKIKMNKHLNLNIGYMWTNYEDYTKKSTNYNGTGLPGTNVYSRTNKVFGLSADYSF